ncbi:MAG: VOC family protein [Deltaproteobacteria bacterium]|nr:VOC family protein [Deltaproteobacteria bacterium]
MRIHHLALRTRSVARLVAFYEGAIGLPVVERKGERSVWLDAGGSLLMIEAAEAGEPPVPVGTMELTAAFAIEATERAGVEARLDAHGVTVEARTSFTLYVRDPDGRRIGLSAYPSALT